MSQHTLLVISKDTVRFEALCKSLMTAAGKISMRADLIESVTMATQYISEHDVDLILIEPSSLAQPAALSVIVKAFVPIPVIVWSTDLANDCSSEQLEQGIVACLNEAMTPSDLILQIFAIVIQLTKAKQAIWHEKQEAAVTLEAIADAVVCTNSRGEITLLNSAARRLLECPFDVVIGRNVTELMSLQDVNSGEPIVHPIHQVITTMQSTRVKPGTVLVRRNKTQIRIEDCSSPVVDDSGALKGVVMVFHDTTEAYEMQVQVDYLAWHDFLTGLPNRFALEKHLDQALAHAGAHRQCVPIIYLDLDKFKLVNDTLGHGTGDKLLISVAERLRSSFRMIDMVGRRGGDEFVVVMAPGSSVEDAILAAARVIEALSKPHQANGREVRVGCSAGIAMFPEHGTSVEVLLHNADTALQNAKLNGRNGWRIFSPELHAESLERRVLEDRLRVALMTGAFTLFYQPKVQLPGGAICGCEALLRWNDPEWGWVPPTKFIPCAEASGLIYLLGRWVLDECLRQMKAWKEASVTFGTIAINISAEELRHPEFIENIRSQLESSQIDPGMLQIELTESMLMQDINQASQSLKKLKELGLSLAVDDFGTGYSSLSYLAEFPIDVLKIDRSFIHGINRAGARQQALLHAILSLAKSLSLVVVAEGIETSEEEHFLLQTGCAIGQGYYYSAPLDAPAFEQLLMANQQTK